MADPFITLNGEQGEFLSRSDVNIMDADTAHCQQALGDWTNSNNSGLSRQPSVDDLFGDGACRATAAAAAIMAFTAGVNSEFRVAVGDTFTFRIAVKSEDSRNVQVWARWFDLAGDVIGAGSRASAVVGTEYTDISVVAVAPALAHTARLRVDSLDVLDAGETLFVKESGILRGDDPTFVPSVRIVSDLQVEIDARRDWNDAASTPLVVVARSATNSVAVFNFTLRDTGAMLFQRQREGANAVFGPSSVAVTLPPDGTRLRIKATHDVTGELWTILFDDVEENTATNTGIPGLNEALLPSNVSVGALFTGATQRFGGDIFSAEIRDGIDGPVVYRMDAADALGSVVS